MRRAAVELFRRAPDADGVTHMRIRIDVACQSLDLFGDDGALIRRYAVSTALLGTGERAGSERTPRGRHRIRAKIGAGMPIGAVFRARRPSGEIWTPQLAAHQPGRDWILSRILWLRGEEWGRNRGVGVDSMRRYIYIHGTGDDQPMGTPLSHGCIRMRNREVIELFELVDVGTEVDIAESTENGKPAQP
jgi:lipoprotein-anchoring transpeptidase ErfK/SrfK